MKITVLMENTALEGCGLTPEAGLSLYIEYRGKKLLLDAGSSGKFAGNAQALGVDLSAVVPRPLRPRRRPAPVLPGE
jgi:7,8-dihydropterin-6-yl-methyl-4-(beta-D-ribofuranosyl)aminobenzene 5'-phosphate synthase